MKTKIFKGFALLVFLLVINMQTQAQTVPFTNNLNCDVVVGYELRGPNPLCSVCDFGSITIPPGTTMYAVDPACGGLSLDGCIWVISIGGTSVSYNHCSNLNCCSINVTAGTAPVACSMTGNFNVIYAYPSGWSINP